MVGGGWTREVEGYKSRVGSGGRGTLGRGRNRVQRGGEAHRVPCLKGLGGGFPPEAVALQSSSVARRVRGWRGGRWRL